MKYLLLILSLMFSSFCLNAEEAIAEKNKTTETSPPKKEEIKEEVSETSHSMTLNGVEIKYKARAGTVLIKDEKGENSKGSFFYIAYIKEGENTANRPITYCFNGGPGSASLWLHLGVLGPKRVKINQEGFTPPPYQVIDNEFSLLDLTDLVFIDPISTGYSRAVPGEDPKQFHGVEEDIKSVGEFIRIYTTRNNRWDSPKFLAGESYGTTRAAGLADYLHDKYSLYLNGIIFVSTVLNFQTLDTSPGNDLPYILFLPTYTASAWYHKKLDPELQKDLKKTLKEVENFAIYDYAQALLLGDLLPTNKRNEIIAKLARYTSLSPSLIDRADLRVCQSRFSKELLRNEKKIIGRFDSRFIGVDVDPCGESSNTDPSADAIFGAFTAAFNAYIRTDLKWEKDDEYKILANVFPWNFGCSINKYLNVADNLRDVMAKNPTLQIYVASGYYDLATPYFATDYTFHHLGLDPSLRSHLKMGYYDAGHMMYIHQPSLEQFKAEAARFITSTLETADQKL